ncbi:pilus assembly protein PilM [Candidatus Dojkabacteria bacterium]|uniref:Pilus assembly protein PilM n=1 Tax=Candidatus Dojkabacteria bacterium TaxID=2099670 RepID=A0A955I6W1_9BACT|nr:pilus assembly protein PilM [Candidatus Dojkabacteria bacterium]
MLDVEFDKATSVRPSLAVEFADGFVRVMRFERKTDNNFALRAFNEVELPAGTIENGVITQTDVVATTLAKAIETSQPHSVNTVYTIGILPQDYTFFLTIELPGIAKEELSDLIKRKVGDILPMSESEVYWDWHRIRTEENRTTIQLAAVPKNIINSYMETFDKAKLIALLFEPSAVSTSRLVYTVDPELSKHSVLVEATETSFIVSLMSNGDIIFSSDVTIQPVSSKENVRILLRKIEQVIGYDKTANIDIKTCAILVYGQNPNISIEDTIKSLNEMGAANANRINYSIESKYLAGHIEKHGKDVYIPLIGAAIRGMGKEKQGTTTINLIPQVAKVEFGRQELANTLRRYLVFVGINVLLLIVMIFVVSAETTKRVEQLSERYESVLNLSESAKVRDVQESINNLNSITGKNLKLVNSVFDWDKLMSAIAAVTQPDIVLNNMSAVPATSGLTQDSWEIVLTGTAVSRSSVITMTDLMRQGGLFNSVKLPLESLEDGQNVNFTIEAKVKYTSLLP